MAGSGFRVSSILTPLGFPLAPLSELSSQPQVYPTPHFRRRPWSLTRKDEDSSHAPLLLGHMTPQPLRAQLGPGPVAIMYTLSEVPPQGGSLILTSSYVQLVIVCALFVWLLMLVNRFILAVSIHISLLHPEFHCFGAPVSLYRPPSLPPSLPLSFGVPRATSRTHAQCTHVHTIRVHT